MDVDGEIDERWKRCIVKTGMSGSDVIIWKKTKIF